jgi:hypothetical protein
MHQGLLQRTPFGSLDNTVHSIKHLDSSPKGLLRILIRTSYNVTYLAMERIEGDKLTNGWGMGQKKSRIENKGRGTIERNGQ